MPSINISNIKNSEKLLGTPRIKPGAAGWEGRMLPLCYAALKVLILGIAKKYYQWWRDSLTALLRFSGLFFVSSAPKTIVALLFILTVPHPSLFLWHKFQRIVRRFHFFTRQWIIGEPFKLLISPPTPTYPRQNICRACSGCHSDRWLLNFLWTLQNFCNIAQKTGVWFSANVICTFHKCRHTTYKLQVR